MLRDVKIKSVTRFMESQFSIETQQCVPPAWRSEDIMVCSPKFIYSSSLLCCAGDCTMEQIAQRSYGVSLAGDIREPSGMQSCAMCSRKTLLEQGGWTKGLF